MILSNGTVPERGGEGFSPLSLFPPQVSFNTSYRGGGKGENNPLPKLHFGAGWGEKKKRRANAGLRDYSFSPRLSERQSDKRAQKEGEGRGENRGGEKEPEVHGAVCTSFPIHHRFLETASWLSTHPGLQRENKRGEKGKRRKKERRRGKSQCPHTHEDLVSVGFVFPRGWKERSRDGARKDGRKREKKRERREAGLRRRACWCRLSDFQGRQVAGVGVQ